MDPQRPSLTKAPGADNQPAAQGQSGRAAGGQSLHSPTLPLDLKLRDRAFFLSASVVYSSPLPVS